MNAKNDNKRLSHWIVCTISIVTAVAVHCLPDSAFAQKQEPVAKNKFMVFGNTYVTNPKVATASILASINKAVQDANIDFVIIVGELTLGATVDQFAAVKQVIDTSPVPVYVTASNHDLVYANGDWKSGKHDDYARFSKMLNTQTEYTIPQGRSLFIMQSHKGGVGTRFTNNELAKIENTTSYDFVYQVVEESLGTDINLKSKPIIGINGGNKGVHQYIVSDHHAKVVPIEHKRTDEEDDYLIFKENEGSVTVDSYIDRKLNKSFKIMIDRVSRTCSIER
ncbi:MAG: metallophosphoesterase [Fuerstiella sp.]